MKKDRLIITIGREYGSGGKIIGEKLAEKMGIKFYDKEIIDIMIKAVDKDGNWCTNCDSLLLRRTGYEGPVYHDSLPGDGHERLSAGRQCI